jgi:hypothetical protein
MKLLPSLALTPSLTDSTTLFDDFSYGPNAKVTAADIEGINKGVKAPGQTAAEGDDDDDKK